MEQEKKKLNLKIIISVALILVVAIIGIVILTNGKMSKEKMLEIAKDLSFTELNNEIKENKSRANEKYSGNVYIITGYVKDFDNKTITLYDTGNTIIKATISKDEINSLDKGQKVTIVGKIDKFEFTEEKESVAGATYTTNTYIAEMKNAYIENDVFVIDGIIEIPDESYLLRDINGKTSWKKHSIDEWYCCINNYDITEFAETKNFTTKEEQASVIAGTTLKNKDVISVKGKIIKESHKIGTKQMEYKIKDLEIIK